MYFVMQDLPDEKTKTGNFLSVRNVLEYYEGDVANLATTWPQHIYFEAELVNFDDETKDSMIASLRARLNSISDITEAYKGNFLSDMISKALNGYVRR